MSIDTQIRDASTARKAEVNEHGELVVGSKSPSAAATTTVAAAATGYSLINPKMGCRIVITGVIASGDKNVNANDGQEFELYESTTGSGTTVETSILKVPLLKNQTESFVPLNIITAAGNWVMAKCEDNNILVSVYYYYV